MICWSSRSRSSSSMPSELTSGGQSCGLPVTWMVEPSTAFTWRAGITYKPVRSLSLYAGAGTSVNPSIENLTQTTPTEAQGALKPEKSRTYEVGAKWDGFRGKLLLVEQFLTVRFDIGRQPKRMVARPLFRQFGVALLERLDDRHVLGQ